MNKTKKLMAGVASTVMAFGMAGCGQSQEEQAARPAEPTEYDCDDWEWDENEGTYYCDDNRSTHFGAYYFMGMMYANSSAMRSSSAYKKYRNHYQSPSSGGGNTGSFKSGIGSGSKGGFGG